MIPSFVGYYIVYFRCKIVWFDVFSGFRLYDFVYFQVLDRMILYLRIVHSYDYYSGVEYPNEDEMPHRCGIMHARGVTPPNKVTDNDRKYYARLSPHTRSRILVE
jgi:hypothetical protein